MKKPEQLSDILTRVVPKNSETYIASDLSGDTVCSRCGGKGFYWVMQDAEIYGEGEKIQAVMFCPECQGHQRRNMAIKLGNLSADITLADFNWDLYETEDTDNIDKARTLTKCYVEDFLRFETEGLGLFITSKMRGSGKTFLAKALGGELINRYAADVMVVTESDVLELSKNRPEDGSDPLSRLITCRVLILDDLGQKTTGKEWLNNVLFRIIDKRYCYGKNILVTSNTCVKDLDLEDRIVDRLNSMVMTIKMPEYDIRARLAFEKKKKFLSEIGVNI